MDDAVYPQRILSAEEKVLQIGLWQGEPKGRTRTVRLTAVDPGCVKTQTGL